MNKNQNKGKKNKEQAKILDHEYEKNPLWNKAKMEELAKRLDFSAAQVYKWHWDRQQAVQHRF